MIIMCSSLTMWHIITHVSIAHLLFMCNDRFRVGKELLTNICVTSKSLSSKSFIYSILPQHFVYIAYSIFAVFIRFYIVYCSCLCSHNICFRFWIWFTPSISVFDWCPGYWFHSLFFLPPLSVLFAGWTLITDFTTIACIYMIRFSVMIQCAFFSAFCLLE